MKIFFQPTKLNCALAVLLVAAGFASTADAALMSRLGGQAVYDTDFNITWLADANYAKTSGYDSDGMMVWALANTWAAGLNVGGYTGWRLPTALNADLTWCTGYNCTGSGNELGNMFYGDINHGLGGVANQSITTTHNANFNLFTNIQSYAYWSGTESPAPDNARFFHMLDGNQGTIGSKDTSFYAWAVRSGDVEPSGVPEPGIFGLMGIGALAWAATRSRRRG
ncbi:MAG: DUF1566 domain-containing protein [Proteobacteria bacterium]|nr:DUF1566 domain-containing protein [Pseudomonadota bacterium]